MNEHAECDRLDLTALRAAYQSGSLTPEQLIVDVYARMEREALPAVWTARVPLDDALAAARALGDHSDGDARPLWGAPFAVKDNIDVAGLPTTAACPAFSYLPTVSASSVQALIDAGAICLGKVNMDQFATGLVGTRSPYGACQNVFDADYLSGGSSSGSAVAVAAHYVTFSLGTDTAGSGRVPAALNNIVGLKATLGLLPTDGMVPACASLDCLSVFASSVEDAVTVREVMLGRPTALSPRPVSFRFGVPKQLEFAGDPASARAFERALARLEAHGGEATPIDFTPFTELGNLLYGPYVVERHLAVGGFIETHPDDVLPVTRAIILGAREVSSREAFTAMQRAAALRQRCLAELAGLDFLVTPTVPTHFTIAADRAEPRAINDLLGHYTRFVNFLGCAVLSIPQDFRADGLPSGISLVALPGRDTLLDALGDALHRDADAGMGRLRHRLAPLPARLLPPPREVRLAVVGAHMRGMALNPQLSALGARYVCTTKTAPTYRLYALPNTTPERPGLVRTRDQGAAIEVELWDLPYAGLGALMTKVPAPLAIGTLELEGGDSVTGFLCEAVATEGAKDISSFGGYRAYVSRS